ncbi:unnamed protein product [Brassica oleracea var. botrytis]
MLASKFATLCIVLICLTSLRECIMFGVAVPLHTAEAPKRIVRRLVFGSIWGR